jgi:hypothetical protein
MSTHQIVELASEYGRYGYRRVTALLNESGIDVGKNRVQRIWRREGLKVPQKQPKRGRLWLTDGSCIRLKSEEYKAAERPLRSCVDTDAPAWLGYS